MAHITAKNAYKSLEERINKFPQGAPPSKTLYQILSILFTEEEARLVAKLPIKAFRLKTAANIWNVSQSEAYKILDNLEPEKLTYCKLDSINFISFKLESINDVPIKVQFLKIVR